MRLVRVVNVPPPFTRGEILNSFTCLVEVATVFEDLGAKGTYRRHLVRVGANGHDDAAADGVELTRERQRLAVVTGARGDDATLPFAIVELPNQVQSASNLERACRVVVLVLHQHAAADPLIEQRVVEQR